MADGPQTAGGLLFEMNKLRRIWLCLSVVVGTGIGVFCFLVLGAIITAKPIREAILSAHGILVSSKPLQLTHAQAAVVTELLKKGELISSNDLLTNVSAYYSTLIQILIGLFFVFGLLSYFTLQSNGRRQIEELSEIMVAKAAFNHFNSVQFDRDVTGKIDRSLQIELEDLNNRLNELEESAERVNELEQRVHELTSKIGPAEEE